VIFFKQEVRNQQMKLKKSLKNAHFGEFGVKGQEAKVEMVKNSYLYSNIIVGDKYAKVQTKNLHKYVSGFSKVPGEHALFEMAEGIAKSVTGKRVEPDGYGPDGFPSWLLALGLI